MRFLWFILAFTFTVFSSAQSSYTIVPIVGSGSDGDGGAATAALLNGPYGLAQDAKGNVYISEMNRGVIRVISPSGVIQTFAGTGVLADGAQGQPALQTALISPASLLIDTDGGLIFADRGSCRIRKVQTNGIVQDLVGTGRCSSANSGFNGGGITGTNPPLLTDIGAVGGMIKDPSGQLIFSDTTSDLVWRVGSDGIVRIIAGTGTAGYGGDGSTATTATLDAPTGVTIDSAGNIYVADSGNCRIRQIGTANTMATVAGNGTCAGPATSWNGVTLGAMNGLAYNAGTNSIVFSGSGQGRIFQLTLSNSNVATIVGNGTRGAVTSAPALQYPIDTPGDILLQGSNILVADTTAFRVLQVANNTVTAFAGSWPQLATYASASSAPLLQPSGICSRPDGSLLVMDEGSGRILSFTSPNQLAAFAGEKYPTGYSGGDGGSALVAQLAQPRRMVCASNGTVYFSDGRKIRSINSQGTISTVLSAVHIGNVVSALNDPTGLAIDPSGRLVFADGNLNIVAAYNLSNNSFTLLAGTGAAGFYGDGYASNLATLNSPGDLVFDPQGNLYIADRGNGRIREVTTNGIIQTVAGDGSGFSYSDITGLPAISVGFDTIEGMAMDPSGQIYISEPLRVSVIKPNGNVYVVGGFRTESDAGVITYAGMPLNQNDGITTDSKGRVYVSVDQIGQVMMILPQGDPGPPPVITEAVSIPGFGTLSAITPGTWVEIVGANLATAAMTWNTSFQGNQAPTSLGGTTVSIAGQPGVLNYVSPVQVNVQIPSNVSTGPQSITVTTPAGTSAGYTVTVDSTEPGLFAPSVFQIGGLQYAGALFVDGVTYVLPVNAYPGLLSRPANAGETIVLYGIGFGATTPPVPSGSIVQQANTLANQVQIFFNGNQANVTSASLVVGAIGLYQFNVVVPSGLPAGATPLTFSLGGTTSSQVVYTAVSGN